MCQERRLTSSCSDFLKGGESERGAAIPVQQKKGFCMFKYTLVVMLAALFGNGTAIAQENRGTAEQRAACAPDAFRLCLSYIPDATNVEACLRQRKSDLSDACRAVFDHAAEAASVRTTGSLRYRGARDEE